MSVNLELVRYKLLRIILFILSVLSIIFAFFDVYGLFFGVVSLIGICFLKHNGDKSKLLKLGFWIAVVGVILSFGFLLCCVINTVMMSHNSKVVFDML